MTTPKCSEKACLYFAEPGQNLCRYHIDMFEFDESLTDSGLDYEALHSGDEDGASSPVAQLSITNWRDRWLDRKEKEDARKFINRFKVANRHRIRRNSGLCCRCGRVAKSGRTLCETCAQRQRDLHLRLWAGRRAKGLCPSCGSKRDSQMVMCEPCRKRSAGELRRLYERRSRVGLCKRCKRPKDPRSRRCSTCLKYESGLMRQIRENRKELGLCRLCAGDKESPNLTICESCRLKMRDYARESRKTRSKWFYSKMASEARRRKRFRDAGICLKCRNHHDCASFLCPACKSAKEANDTVKAQAWLAKGMCARCRANPVVESRRCCVACLEKRRVSNEARRERLRRSNLCTQCGRNRPAPGAERCSKCAERRISAA
jgi:hypothetical protein